MESESRSNEGDLGAEEGKKKEGEQTSERKINEGDEVENEKKKTTKGEKVRGMRQKRVKRERLRVSW